MLLFAWATLNLGEGKLKLRLCIIKITNLSYCRDIRLFNINYLFAYCNFWYCNKSFYINMVALYFVIWSKIGYLNKYKRRETFVIKIMEICILMYCWVISVKHYTDVLCLRMCTDFTHITIYMLLRLYFNLLLSIFHWTFFMKKKIYNIDI